MGRTGTTCSVILTVLGLALIGVGVALIFVFPGLIRSKLEKSVPLRPDSPTYDTWVTPPAPIYLEIYFFHVVNPDEIVNKGATPQVEQKGPYTYREIKNKENVTFSDDGDFVKYQQPKFYIFERDLSVGSENDSYTLVNFPILTVATFLKDSSSFVQFLAKGALGVAGEKLFNNYTVHEYLFGFRNPTIQSLNKFLPEKVNDTFGLFYGPTGNGTSDGFYEIYTGVDHIQDMSLIKTWKNQTAVPYWNSSYCNMINGSDGQSWHPYIEKDETLYLFSSDVCRSLYVTYEKDTNIKGVNMYRFSVPPEVLANHTTNPDNACYCTKARGCLGAGVVDIGECKGGAPLILSLPHFYEGDPRYVEAIKGLKPDPEIHATVLDVEPFTGTVLHAAKKLQFNIYIEKLGAWGQTEQFTNPTIFPIIWVNESGSLTEQNANDFQNKVIWPMEMTKIIQYCIMGVGGVLIIISVICLIACKARQAGSKENLLVVSDPEYDRGLLDPSRVSS